MTSEQVFMYAKSYKMYFSTSTYDFIKYQGHIKTPAFITQRDRHFYYRLSVRLNDEEIHALFLHGFFYKPSAYIAELCTPESTQAGVAFAARAQNGIRLLAENLYDLRKRIGIDALASWLYAKEDAALPGVIEDIIAKELPLDIAALLLLIPHAEFQYNWSDYWTQRESSAHSFGVRPWLDRLRKVDQLLYWRRAQWRQQSHALAQRFWQSYECDSLAAPQQEVALF